jgi:hypothetical protein
MNDANNATFIKGITLVNTGQKWPVLSAVRKDPGMAAVVSKVVRDGRRQQTYGEDGQMKSELPNVAELHGMSNTIARNVRDSQTITQLLPDLEMCVQIITSTVLSPKDMLTTELNYGFPEGFLNPDVNAAILAVVKGYFEQDYKIKPLLPKMLRDTLFDRGSYPVAVLPENTIDAIINGRGKVSMEDLRHTGVFAAAGGLVGTGLLGHGSAASTPAPTATTVTPGFNGISLESFKEYVQPVAVDNKLAMEGVSMPSYVTVTDNFSVLKMPLVAAKFREQQVRHSLGIAALENEDIEFISKADPKAGEEKRVQGQDAIDKGKVSKLTDREMSSLIYKSRSYKYDPMTTASTPQQLARNSVGNPLIMELPSESVIPVFIPGSPHRHVGYYVLLDHNGNPMSKLDDENYFQQLAQRLNGANGAAGGQGSFPSTMIQKLQTQTNGFDCSNRAHLDLSARVYSEMIEKDLIDRLKNGVYSNGVSLAYNEEVYRIMLARALSMKQSQLLFLPVELMTYFAFKYNADGIGKSMFDDMKVLNSLRAMVMFADVMASVRNSVGLTNVNMKLDEDDPDPIKTMEKAMTEITRGRVLSFPLGTNSPVDIVDGLRRAGYQMTFEGHPGLPDSTVSFTETSTSYVKPDQELANNLKKQSINALGLSPEVIDGAQGPDFATTVVQNNMLLSRRISQIADAFEPMVSDHLRKVGNASEKLRARLRQVIALNMEKILTDEKHKPILSDKVAVAKIAERIMEDVFRNLEVHLPRPDSVSEEAQNKAMVAHKEMVTEAVDYYINSRFFTQQFGGEVAAEADTIKEILIAHYMRKYMADNGILPELSDITTQTSEGKPGSHLAEMNKGHLNSMIQGMVAMISQMRPAVVAANKAFKIMNVDASETPEPAGDAGGGGGDDFGGGLPDFGSGDDLTGGGDTGGAGDEGGANPPEGGDGGGGTEGGGAAADTSDAPQPGAAGPEDDGA